MRLSKGAAPGQQIIGHCPPEAFGRSVPQGPELALSNPNDHNNFHYLNALLT
jgi:hypothetical protein